jgi:hypothetical protein
MNMVRLAVRCREQYADEVFELLSTLRNRAEVSSCLLKGKLGLKLAIDLLKTLQQGDNPGPVHQRVVVYRRGVVQATNRST